MAGRRSRKSAPTDPAGEPRASQASQENAPGVTQQSEDATKLRRDAAATADAILPPSSGPTTPTEATLQALREQNKTLEVARQQAESRLDREWRWPKIAVVVITFVTAGYAIFTFAQQLLVVAEISRRSEQLQNELSIASETVRDTRAKFEAAELRFRKSLADQRDKYAEERAEETRLFREEFEKLVSEAASKSAQQQASTLTQMANAQRILSLVSMGREQIFLKKNPIRALVFANAAHAVYKDSALPIQIDAESDAPVDPEVFFPQLENTKAPSPVSSAIYPTIWNLQLECMLQSKDFESLERRSEEVIGNHTHACLDEALHCTLRSAFYYRSLSRIDRISRFHDGLHTSRVNEPGHQQKYRALFRDTQADLRSVIGSEPDRSIGMVYQGLLHLLDGKYRDCEKTLLEFDPQKREGSSARTSTEGATNMQLALTALEICDFIQTADMSLTAINCNLDSDALSEWDAHLLERLVRAIIARRDWHLENAVVADENGGDREPTQDEMKKLRHRLAMHCVDWILALRLACRLGTDSPGGCTNCGAGVSTGALESSDVTRANLLSELSLPADPDGPTYSRNRALGILFQGRLWMKSLDRRFAVEMRTRTVNLPNGEIVEESYTVDVPQRVNELLPFDPNLDIPAKPYVRVSEEDVSQIRSQDLRQDNVPIESPNDDVVPPAPVVDPSA